MAIGGWLGVAGRKETDYRRASADRKALKRV
jgi:hypothetical protein